MLAMKLSIPVKRMDGDGDELQKLSTGERRWYIAQPIKY